MRDRCERVTTIELRTERLALRPVSEGDLADVAALGSDARVMAMLGGTLSHEQSRAWLDRQRRHWADHRYGRFVARRDGAFVGLVGLSRTDFDAGIVPGIEIAWRLAFAHWGHGYATEAARAVLRDGAVRLGIRDVIAVTTPGNERSLAVMRRLGMSASPSESFEHPRLPAGERAHVVHRLRWADEASDVSRA
ncbi:MAG TPA: GNAT family N-acetyltransferase [Labilithrix sp.]|jgi:ribosomal-protein-alanine N-acetyltransferase